MAWQNDNRRHEIVSYKAETLKSPSLALDFDGVINAYRGWKGECHYEQPIEGAIEGMKNLRKEGNRIFIYTARKPSEYDCMKEWFKEHGIRVRAIKSKEIATYYVDDRAIPFFGDWQSLLKTIKILEGKEEFFVENKKLIVKDVNPSLDGVITGLFALSIYNKNFLHGRKIFIRDIKYSKRDRGLIINFSYK